MMHEILACERSGSSEAKRERRSAGGRSLPLGNCAVQREPDKSIYATIDTIKIA